MSRPAKKVFAASRLPTNTGVSGWVAMLPPRQAKPRLAGRSTADVVIIGGGFAGLSAARRVGDIDRSLRVAVLEAGVIGDAAAGRNSGFIIDLPHDVSSEDYGGDTIAKNREAIEISRTAIALASAVAEEQRWERTIFDPCGRYSVAISDEGDRHLVKYAEGLAALGERHQLLDARGIADITGVETYTSGLFMPGTVMVQPAAYIRGLADSLRDPVTVYENSPAVRIEGGGGEWTVTTPHGAISTGRIILANNGHAESFGFFESRLLHVFTWASMTRAFDPGRLRGQRNWAATPALPMGTTVRRIAGERGDRILVRSRYTYHAGIEAGNGTLRRAAAKHDQKYSARFPALADVPMEYRWGGAMALTWNAVPAFGEIERGIFAACGCNGVGATKATANGIAAADLMLGRKSRLTEIFARFEAPRPLPMQPFRTIGAKANLAFKEWRAGAE
ncbi:MULTISPECIES: FAD-binding oxidoreductase [unclassified Shinella]|uniref:NAD(P)/FAD-dependent oxidoreductase n=1 Tax=unclassified Shinella TaxID=2643062 RepID=UPI00234EE129|nr:MULTISPECIES: FAD-binding oxidoreductase [unclassified Shinella]MCO5139267.1 FAD-binding oxidoreductase [Shinella sp.]MDC7256004.1 FAD-binding oxidoreductase [Shinella sp. YE25]